MDCIDIITGIALAAWLAWSAFYWACPRKEGA